MGGLEVNKARHGQQPVCKDGATDDNIGMSKLGARAWHIFADEGDGCELHQEVGSRNQATHKPGLALPCNQIWL
jgi:hypothetical protein